MRLTEGAGYREVVLDEHNSGNGELLRTIRLSSGTSLFALPRQGVTPFEGVLSRSVDGRYLSVAGYAVDAGSLSVGASNPRVIARIDADGGVDTSTLIDGGFGIASAVTIDGTRYWFGGRNPASLEPGIRTIAHGPGTATSVIFNQTGWETRAVVLRAGALYFSNASPLNSGVLFLGDAGTAPANASMLPGVRLTSPGNFDFIEGSVEKLYVADRSLGGVRKYTRPQDAGTWSETARFLPGLRDGGTSSQSQQCIFVASRQVGSDVIVLCVPFEVGGMSTRVVKFIDVAGQSGDLDAGVTLIVAPAGGEYLGVAF